jgi:hypothetical protein
MKHVLFVGNSYTYYSDMPEKLCAPMAEAAGFPCTVTSVTVGGCTLSRFADENDGPGKKLRDAIVGQRYDMVVLQEYGTGPVRDPESFEKSAAALMALLQPQAERFMFYATCGRKTGHPDLEKLGMTEAELDEALACAYDRAGTKLGLPVAHVGRAFLRHMAEHPGDELYDPDLLHPSLLGSTLAAREILQVMMEQYAKD